MSKKILVDEECYNLANHFLEGESVRDPLTPKAEMLDRARWRECGARAAMVGLHRWCGAFDRRRRIWWLEGYDDVAKANDPGVPVFSPGPCWVER